jgi:hypothetical protein
MQWLAFLRSIPVLEFKIMKIRLLVVSALLAIGLAACGEDAKKAEAAKPKPRDSPAKRSRKPTKRPRRPAKR